MHWFWKGLLLLLLLLVSFPLGARLAGWHTAETGAGSVAMRVTPDLPGGGSVYVPVADWGVRFQLFKSPLLLQAEPRTLDRQGALEIAAGNEALLRSAEREIRSGAEWALARYFGVVLLLLLLGGWTLWRIFPGLGKRFPLYALGGGFTLSLLFVSLALLTYNSGSFSQPSFYARGAELDQILNSFERESQGQQGSYRNNFQKVLRSVSSLLTESSFPDPGDGYIVASDIHSNALALQALGDLVGSRPVFFVGDFGYDGNDGEAALLAPEIASVSERVIATSGNHDSGALMRELAGQGVEVLGSRGVLQVDGSWRPGGIFLDGLLVRGWDDPLEWQGAWPGDPDRPFSLEQTPGAREAAERELWSWWRRIRRKPDVLLIHQPALVEFLVGRLGNYPRPLTILTGHDHLQWVQKEGNIRIVDAGSVGAGGILGIGREEAELAEIYFSSKELQTVDMIGVDPLEGSGRAERIQIDQMCECRYRVPSLPRTYSQSAS